MTENRLELVEPDLSAHLLTASVSQRRTVALIACRFALDVTHLNDPTIKEGLDALAMGKYGDTVLRKKLESLVTQLDEIQWDLQDLMDEGRTELSNYLAAFRRARAANSLYLAFSEDALQAATECIYEASAATDELATLKQLVLAALDPKQVNIAAGGLY